MTNEEKIKQLEGAIYALSEKLEERSKNVIDAFQEVQDLANSFKKSINQLQFEVNTLLTDKKVIKWDS